ncbi:putative cell cycle control protein [Ceratocystis lukuohia]|uniref:Cell cycle control protein n=1 Tax=Ceratocystis lukuohia TaxID=2019550 RepID=A0ABR4MJK3_9PEZI
MSDNSAFDDRPGSLNNDDLSASDFNGEINENGLNETHDLLDEPDVIDLTEEPDSPVRPVPAHPVLLLPSINDPVRNPLPNPAHHAYRHHASSQPIVIPDVASRHGRAGNNSARQSRDLASRRPLRQGGVIDLTLDDSPERTRSARPNQSETQGQTSRVAPLDADLLIVGENINRNINNIRDIMPHRLYDAASTASRLMLWGHAPSPVPHIRGPLGSIIRRFGHPMSELEHRFGQYSRPATTTPFRPPSPQLPPPLPLELEETREGFTRSTGEDIEMVCPSCDNALEFDPLGDRGENTSKKRTKRDQAEHYFWAVKACGHHRCIATTATKLVDRQRARA